MVDVGAAIDAVRRPMNPGLSPRVRGNPAQVVFDFQEKHQIHASGSAPLKKPCFHR